MVQDVEGLCSPDEVDGVMDWQGALHRRIGGGCGGPLLTFCPMFPLENELTPEIIGPLLTSRLEKLDAILTLNGITTMQVLRILRTPGPTCGKRCRPDLVK